MGDIAEILRGGGYTVVEGFDAVMECIHGKVENGERLCSGYGVFPGGDKCEGCADCKDALK